MNSFHLGQKMMKKIRGIIIGVGMMVLGTAMAGCGGGSEQLEFTAKLGDGINIGNSLDATNLRDYEPQAPELDYEVFWGNPKITVQQFEAIRGAGFESVRIPVTWEDHMDADGTISAEWMERVAEVVDMALEQDLYVILDTHHEEWLNLEVEHQDAVCAQYEMVWTQIAERFADYDERLLFEGMNEPRLRDSEHEWNAGTPELRAMVNRLNTVFVETVRGTGGNNASRYLLICPYATNTETEALEELTVPDGNIIVAVHMYKPYSFCQDKEGTADWSKSQSADTEEIRRIFSDLKRLFIDKKIPVVITEYGCEDKNNEATRAAWVSFVRERASEAGIPCVWWDNGSSYKVFDRNTGECVYEKLLEALTEDK